MIKPERVEYWHGLREELRRSKAADTVELRDFHLDRAEAYADRLAQDDDIGGTSRIGSSEYRSGDVRYRLQHRVENSPLIRRGVEDVSR